MPMPTLLLTARATCAALCATALFAGCSVLPKREPVQIWQPHEGTSVPTVPTVPATDSSLRIDTPNTSGLLDQTAIVVWPEPGQISTYKGARWSMPPALLVRDRLVDAFMAAKLPAVTTDEDHLASDYTLGGNLRAFQSEYRSGSPIVVVRFDAQLRRGGSRSLLATRSFEVTQQPAGIQVPQIVAAFGAADDQLSAEVVPWVLEQIRSAPAADVSATPKKR